MILVADQYISVCRCYRKRKLTEENQHGRLSSVNLGEYTSESVQHQAYVTTKHHHPFAITRLYCMVREAHVSTEESLCVNEMSCS